MNRFKQIAQEMEDFRRSCPPEWKERIELDEQAAKALARTQERMKQVPGEMAQLSVQLAKRGWYVWMDMPFSLLYAVRDALNEKRFEIVGRALMRYFKKEGRRIESTMRETFPNRGAILKSAFRADRRKDYALSVPVFLAQADGICSELLGVGFYSRRKGTPRTASAAARFRQTEIMSGLLEPLRVTGPLNALEDERHDYPDVLNRHEVLHGKSMGYATPLSSFRAFSLLAYVGSALVTAKEYVEFLEEQRATGCHSSTPSPEGSS